MAAMGKCRPWPANWATVIAFVLPPDDARHDLNIRFFTPRREAAFVGHATLAAHAVLHSLEPRALRRQRGQTGTVEVTALDADRGFAIRQGPPVLGRLLTADELGAVLALLGLTRAQLDPECPPQIVGAGSTRLLLGVGTAPRWTRCSHSSTRWQNVRRARRTGLLPVHAASSQRGLRHRGPDVLPGDRHRRGSGQRQRTCDARCIPRLSRVAFDQQRNSVIQWSAGSPRRPAGRLVSLELGADGTVQATRSPARP
jgi:hypothetical protein